MKTWSVLKKEGEISVIHKDNSHGRKSYGWGGEDKIILFHNNIGGNDIDFQDKGSKAFAEKCAKILCDGLNKDKETKNIKFSN